MPDYGFARLYEEPIKNLVIKKEVDSSFAIDAIYSLRDFTQFHHDNYPLIYSTTEWIHVLYFCNDVIISLYYANRPSNVLKNFLIIGTKQGATIIKVNLDEIGPCSIKSILMKFVRA